MSSAPRTLTAHLRGASTEDGLSPEPARDGTRVFLAVGLQDGDRMERLIGTFSLLEEAVSDCECFSNRSADERPKTAVVYECVVGRGEFESSREYDVAKRTWKTLWPPTKKVDSLPEAEVRALLREIVDDVRAGYREGSSEEVGDMVMETLSKAGIAYGEEG